MTQEDTQPSQTCPGGPINTSLLVANSLQLGSIIESNTLRRIYAKGFLLGRIPLYKIKEM